MMRFGTKKNDFLIFITNKCGKNGYWVKSPQFIKHSYSWYGGGGLFTKFARSSKEDDISGVLPRDVSLLSVNTENNKITNITGDSLYNICKRRRNGC